MKLKVISGPRHVGQTFELYGNAALVIGRSPSADIRIADPGISKKHCRLILLDGQQAEVTDLGSSNGTFVNGMLIKSKSIRMGDVISLHQYKLRLESEAPDVPLEDFHASSSIKSPEFQDSVAYKTQKKKSLAEQIQHFIDHSMRPALLGFGKIGDTRTTFFGLLGFWIVLTAILTIGPFRERALNQLQANSTETALLYARQLARINQDFVIEGRFESLVTDLDSFKGQTKGLVEAMVLDAERFQILAPPRLMGRPLPSVAAAQASRADKERVSYDSSGNAYVSVPIKVGTANGDKVVAISYVIFRYNRGQFSWASVLDGASTSILLSLLFGIIVFAFFRVWFDRPIQDLSQEMNHQMSGLGQNMEAPVKWPALEELFRQSSFLINKANAPVGPSPSSFVSSLEPQHLSTLSISNERAVQTLQPFMKLHADSAMIAVDSQRRVQLWTDEAEKLFGASLLQASGQDISQVFHDLSIETAVSSACDLISRGQEKMVLREVPSGNRTLRFGVTQMMEHYLIRLEFHEVPS